MHKPMKFFTDHEILMSGYVCCRSSTSEVIIKKKKFCVNEPVRYRCRMLRIVYLGFDLLCPNRHHVVQANVPPTYPVKSTMLLPVLVPLLLVSQVQTPSYCSYT